MMETFDQWYDRQPRVSLDRKSEHRLTWEACEKQHSDASAWHAIDYAPKGRRLLVRTESGEIYAAHWVACPITGDEAWLVSEAPDGTQHLVRAIEWREIGGTP